MYSFLLPNYSKLVSNEHSFRNKTVTSTAAITRESQHFIYYEEDETRQIQDMNFTLISTLRATGATTTQNSSDSNNTNSSTESLFVSTEQLMDRKYSQDVDVVTPSVVPKVSLSIYSIA